MVHSIRQEVERRINEILHTHPEIEIGYLDETELADAKKRRAEARASLACEGLDLTAEDEALFDMFEERRYAHDTCRRLLIEYLRQTTPRRQAELVP